MNELPKEIPLVKLRTKPEDLKTYPLIYYYLITKEKCKRNMDMPYIKKSNLQYKSCSS